MRQKFKFYGLILAAFVATGLFGATWSGVLEQRLTTALGSRGAALELLNSTGASASGVSVITYGANGSDTVNDTTAINAAIEAVYAAGGGNVNIPAGTYYVQGLNLREKVHVRGAGMFTTYLKLPSVATTRSAPTASLAMFRLPSGYSVASWYGGGIYNLSCDGQQFALTTVPPTAVTGNTLRCVDFSSVTTGIQQFTMQEVDIRYFDTAVQASPLVANNGSFGDMHFTMINCRLFYNFVGLYGQEHPELLGNQFWFNGTAMTGRYVDMYVIGNQFTLNATGITSDASIVNSCRFVGCTFYQNETNALDINSYNQIVGCEFVGDVADTSSIGVNIKGINNTIDSCMFGGGTTGTAFGVCAIGLDNLNNSNIASGTIISNNRFSCSSACPAIMGRDSTITGGPLVGNSATLHSVSGVTISGNFFSLAGKQAIQYNPGSGSFQFGTITGNIARMESGSLTGALFEVVAFKSVITDNVLHNVAGTVTNGINLRTSIIGADQQLVVSGNNFQGAFTLPIAAIGTASPLSRIHNNVGYVTEKTGTGQIVTATSVAVTHGLAGTPAIGDILITPQGTTAVVGQPYVSAVSSTTFTVTIPVSGSLNFSYTARYRP